MIKLDPRISLTMSQGNRPSATVIVISNHHNSPIDRRPSMIHVDVERPAQDAGADDAHGFLTLSWCASRQTIYASSMPLAGSNYG